MSLNQLAWKLDGTRLAIHLIKRGGVMGGHDINFYGVMRAVGEFAQENQLHPRTDEQDWWIVKK